jgi:pyridoxine kinase
VPLALVLSSFVAASRIGGAAQQYVLAAHGIDPVLTPTALYGRNPARGSEGDPTHPDVFRRMLADIEADALFGMVDLVLTGHFALAEQVEIAADVLERVRAASPRRPIVVVDPIMGDAPAGLYVRPEVAKAVAERLVPLADWITPNTWELQRLSGRPVSDAREAVEACRRLGRDALVTSAPVDDGRIGVVCCAKGSAVLFSHKRAPSAPHGTGDLVAASFGAGLVEGLEPEAAAERAVRAVAQAVEAAGRWKAPELPIVALGDRMVRPTAEVIIERLDG